MRKIERMMCKAIDDIKTWSSGNTQVVVDQHTAKAFVYLHGHCLGFWCYTLGKFKPDTQTLLRWTTRTTCSRLRALGVNVQVKQYQPYIDGVKVVG